MSIWVLWDPTPLNLPAIPAHKEYNSGSPAGNCRAAFPDLECDGRHRQKGFGPYLHAVIYHCRIQLPLHGCHKNLTQVYKG